MTRAHEQPTLFPTSHITASELAFHGHARLQVSSPSFAHEASIPERHSAYHDGRSPALSWSEGPSGTASYAILLEDPDAPGATPYVHWVLYNVPARVHVLPEALPVTPTLEAQGASQGVGTRGTIGYFGPRPPARDAAHRYCFEVFALDTPIDLPAGAGCDEVREAMRGHVLANGVLTGKYAARR